MSTAFYEIQPRLPWDVSPEEKRRLMTLYTGALFFIVLFSVLILITPVKVLDRSVEEAVPPRVAQLLIKQEPFKPIPIPPKPEVKPEEKKPEAKPEQKQEVKKEEPKPVEPPKVEPPKPVKQEIKPKPIQVQPKNPTPEPGSAGEAKHEAAKAEARAAASVFDSLSDLRDTSQIKDSLNPNLPTGQLLKGSQAAATGPGDGVSRALIASNAAGAGSGGISVGKASSGYGTRAGGGGGGSGLSGVAGTKVGSALAAQEASRAGGSGGSGSGGVGSGSGAGGAKATRSTEQISLVFQKIQGALQALYMRAQRENPGMEGKVVLKLSIAPDGTVSRCDIYSSELGDADLERKIVLKVKSTNFGTANAGQWDGNWTLNFTPGR